MKVAYSSLPNFMMYRFGNGTVLTLNAKVGSSSAVLRMDSYMNCGKYAVTSGEVVFKYVLN